MAWPLTSFTQLPYKPLGASSLITPAQFRPGTHRPALCWLGKIAGFFPWFFVGDSPRKQESPKKLSSESATLMLDHPAWPEKKNAGLKWWHAPTHSHTHTVDGSEIRRSPVEVGSLSHYLQYRFFCYSDVGQISEPSTAWLMCHQISRGPPWRSQSQREDFSGNPLFESNWLQFCWERYQEVAGQRAKFKCHGYPISTPEARALEMVIYQHCP